MSTHHHHCGAQIDATELVNQPVLRNILWFALIINALMFCVEIAASIVSDSMSLQADAVDFFSDAVTYAISLLVLGSALATRAKAGLFKGVCMGAFGLFVVINAALRVVSGQAPDPTIMGVVGTMALFANVTVAFLLFRYRGGDSNMQSIWLCSRNDAIANIAILIAAAGVFTTSSRWPDLVITLLIASLSLSSAYQVIRLALQELRHFGRDV